MPQPSIPDYSISIKTPQLVHPPILANGHPIEKGNNVIKYAGGFCVVFPYETSSQKYAVRCWHAEIADAKKRTQLIAEALKASKLPYFVGFEYYEDGIITSLGLQPVVVMDWVNAAPLKKYIAEHINEANKLNDLAENFKTMVADLHRHHFAHGDLQHGNIMIRDDGSLVLVDYDSMFVPALDGMKDEIKGLQGYQHEARWKNEYVTEKADYFSELVIYLSIKAFALMPDLWNDLKLEDTETMIFSADDIKSKGSSDIFHILNTQEELKPLVEKLCDYMQCSTIDDLSPLECATISISDAISSKWEGGNGYVVKPIVAHIDNADDITSKWESGNGYVKAAEEEIVESIITGWKK